MVINGKGGGESTLPSASPSLLRIEIAELSYESNIQEENTSTKFMIVKKLIPAIKNYLNTSFSD